LAATEAEIKERMKNHPHRQEELRFAADLQPTSSAFAANLKFGRKVVVVWHYRGRCGRDHISGDENVKAT